MKVGLLRVDAKGNSAGAVWEKPDGAWVCTRTSPSLKWMVGKTTEAVKATLANDGLPYEWIDITDFV